jgi:tetratricopeptide (TPR) repeat protein
MLKTAVVLMAIAPLGIAVAQQEPKPLALPRVHGSEQFESNKPTNDPVSLYKNPREAALNALKAAYNTAVVEHSRARGIRLLLISLKREPTDKALYDLGILCVDEERWGDAINFQREVQRLPNADPEVVKLAGAEIERVQAIMDLEITSDGKQLREFDIRFLQALKKSDKDPIAALTDLRSLRKKYATQWEVPALEGILQSDKGDFAESLKALEEAGRLAPRSRSPRLQSAIKLVRQEADFKEQVNDADKALEGHQYESAAQHYAAAWEDRPARLNVGMQAAASFLMADQVEPAVQILSRMRASAGDLDSKIKAMLRELGAVSDEAKNEAERSPGAAATSSPEDRSKQLRDLVGELTSPKMELAAAADPALLTHAGRIIPFTDDELTAGHTDLDILTAESLYERYRRDRGSVATSNAAATAPEFPPHGPPVSKPPQLPPAISAPAALPDHPDPLLDRPAALPDHPAPPSPTFSGMSAHPAGGQTVLVSSDPAGAALSFDNGSFHCTTPCDVPASPGDHFLTATLDCYRVATRLVTVEKAKKQGTFNVVLEPKAGKVYVESAVPSVPIFVNGRKTENLTPWTFTLPEGEYEIAVESGGAMSEVRKITVHDQGMQKISF